MQQLPNLLGKVHEIKMLALCRVFFCRLTLLIVIQVKDTVIKSPSTGFCILSVIPAVVTLLHDIFQGSVNLC